MNSLIGRENAGEEAATPLLGLLKGEIQLRNLLIKYFVSVGKKVAKPQL